MNLASKAIGLSLEHPIMNAAGTCKSFEDVERLSRSATAAIVLGSITKEKRAGNTGTVYWLEEHFALNSLGLPNPGAEYYEANIPKMVDVAHEAGKPLIVSIAGFSTEEYGELSLLALEAGADAIELNLGCPNIWSDGKQKMPISFDPELVEEILRHVGNVIGPKLGVSVKLSPILNPVLLAELANMINRPWFFNMAITTTNTLPNALVLGKSGKPRITPGGGLAGMSGPALKPIALGQVKQLRDLIPDNDLKLIGVGGIRNGVDVLDYVHAGANAVQVATEYLEKGERIFSSMLFQIARALDPDMDE